MLPMRIPALFALCAGPALHVAAAQSIAPELAAQNALFARKVYQVAPNVYSAVGYSLGNSILRSRSSRHR